MKRTLLGLCLLVIAIVVSACGNRAESHSAPSSISTQPVKASSVSEENLSNLYLAGGCFWGVEAYMARIPGFRM